MKHLQFRIKKVRQETRDSKSYFIEEVNGEQVIYNAGQFLTLIVDLHGKEVRRSYSITSAPTVDEHISFTIKRIENGELSRYLFDTLHEDDIITSLPPTGRFTIDEASNELTVFIAAGSGITPVYSLIKQLLHHHPDSKILLLYQNRNEEDSIFRKELLRLAQTFQERFAMEEIFSQPLALERLSQRLNNTLLEKILTEKQVPPNASFYLCGPETFMRMVQFTLKVMGFNDSRIRKENFFAVAPPPPFMADTKPHEVIIHFHHNTHKLQVAYPQNILEAALKQNLQLPYSCRGGRCSTCTAKCTQGKIKMSINDVLTPKDLDAGLILTCVSYPETDVELMFD